MVPASEDLIRADGASFEDLIKADEVCIEERR
jgi:hypothetical protein